MAPKLKLRLGESAPRNSFTQTDYYRTTREEIHSPISRIESLSPDSPNADLSKGAASPTLLAHIREDSSEDREADGGGQQRAEKRTVLGLFWQVFHALFRKWRRQKDRASETKSAQR